MKISVMVLKLQTGSVSIIESKKGHNSVNNVGAIKQSV